MEQILFFERLSIAGHNEAGERISGSPPSSSESSPIMTPETSDDEDEDEDLLFSPERVYHAPDEAGKDLLDTADPKESKDEVEVGNLLNTTEVPSKKPEDGGPPVLPRKDVHDTLPATPEQSPNEDENSPNSAAALSKQHEDRDTFTSTPPDESHSLLDAFDGEQDELLAPIIPEVHDGVDFFHDTLGAPDTYYGSRLSAIRDADRVTLEEASRDISTEQTRAQTRILLELKSVHEDETIPYISVVPIDGNLHNCLASLEGSPGTPYEGGVFWLHIEYPEDYPMKPPHITFLTPVYHPNIDETGRICLDILETSWSPCLHTRPLLLSILSVLHNPILEDALVSEIAQKYELDYRDYCDIARLYTEEIAHAVRPDTLYLLNHSLADS